MSWFRRGGRRGGMWGTNGAVATVRRPCDVSQLLRRGLSQAASGRPKVENRWETETRSSYVYFVPVSITDASASAADEVVLSDVVGVDETPAVEAESSAPASASTTASAPGRSRSRSTGRGRSVERASSGAARPAASSTSRPSAAPAPVPAPVPVEPARPRLKTTASERLSARRERERKNMLSEEEARARAAKEAARARMANSRFLSNTGFSRLNKKPPFHPYGWANRRPVHGGLMFGNYMSSHNISPLMHVANPKAEDAMHDVHFVTPEAILKYEPTRYFEYAPDAVQLEATAILRGEAFDPSSAKDAADKDASFSSTASEGARPHEETLLSTARIELEEELGAEVESRMQARDQLRARLAEDRARQNAPVPSKKALAESRTRRRSSMDAGPGNFRSWRKTSTTPDPSVAGPPTTSKSGTGERRPGRETRTSSAASATTSATTSASATKALAKTQRTDPLASSTAASAAATAMTAPEATTSTLREPWLAVSELATVPYRRNYSERVRDMLVWDEEAAAASQAAAKAAALAVPLAPNRTARLIAGKVVRPPELPKAEDADAEDEDAEGGGFDEDGGAKRGVEDAAATALARVPFRGTLRGAPDARVARTVVAAPPGPPASSSPFAVTASTAASAMRSSSRGPVRVSSLPTALPPGAVVLVPFTPSSTAEVDPRSYKNLPPQFCRAIHPAGRPAELSVHVSDCLHCFD